MSQSARLPSMSFSDSSKFIADVALPTIAKGIIVRRRPIVGLAERFDLDLRAVRRMQRLRSRYGNGPLLLRNPIRPQLVLFDPRDVQRVLAGAPSPFSPASCEKKAALSHFEPHVSLVSAGAKREARRALNDDALESDRPVHRLGTQIVAKVEEEADALLSHAVALGTLDWDTFFQTWFRIVRRVVLGDRARDDRELTDLLAQLRARANWAFAYPKSHAGRALLHERLARYLERPEAGSLSAIVTSMSSGKDNEPTHQIAQWLFAFDPAGMATCRALALLVAHPESWRRAEAEVREASDRTDLPFLRAVVVETLRLYPTTPMVLRQTSEDTHWDAGVLPAGSGILVYAPFFHRDDERLPQAHRFEPEAWLGKDPSDAIPLVPFSAGPAACPARHLVPLMASAFLARLIASGRPFVSLQPSRLDVAEPLPGTLDPFTLRFAIPAGS